LRHADQVALHPNDAGDLGLPHACVARIRRDGYDILGMLVSKGAVYAVASLGEDRVTAADLAGRPRPTVIESVYRLRDIA
jgi:hypothetical protein